MFAYIYLWTNTILLPLVFFSVCSIYSTTLVLNTDNPVLNSINNLESIRFTWLENVSNFHESGPNPQLDCIRFWNENKVATQTQARQNMHQVQSVRVDVFHYLSISICLVQSCNKKLFFSQFKSFFFHSGWCWSK